MNMESLWEQTCVLLAKDMNYVSYDTWVENNMVPTEIKDDTVIISMKMESMIPMIQKKYLGLIEKCLTESAGKPMKAMLVSKSQAEKMTVSPAEPDKDENDPHLNPKYTFENFVVGSGNRFAHAAALAVAESPAEAYNPLFIYGGVGLGKTHLMQAIGHFIHQNDPEKKILYMTSESFTNELISAIQQKNTFEFREKIRKVDVLMVDDIQFIAGRESTQQEFFNTFNELHNENKQIILTSDKPPKDIPLLEERLKSRFQWGILADIGMPDYETRLAILRKKVQTENIIIEDFILATIAQKIDSNIREIEGALNKIVAYANLTHSPITIEIAEKAIVDHVLQNEKIISSDYIKEIVAKYFNISKEDLVSAKKSIDITYPRQIAMFLCRSEAQLSFPKIGQDFGGRDHTTVMHAVTKIEKEIKQNTNTKLIVDSLRNIIRDNN